MVSLTDEVAAPELPELLGNALRELENLQQRAQRVRGSKSWAAGRLLSFSPSALDRLCRLLREGCELVGGRLDSLRSARTESFRIEKRVGIECGREKSTSRRSLSDDARSLLIAYRTCGRALCASLVEARRISDANTAALLAGLVHRLEKQLWLLDAQETQERAPLRAIAVFLSC